MFSRCSYKGVEEKVEFPRIILRVFAGGGSRTTSAETEYRWNTEICSFFLCFPTSSFVADGLYDWAVLQPVDYIRCAGTFDKSDVNGGIVQIRADVVLE